MVSEIKKSIIYMVVSDFVNDQNDRFVKHISNQTLKSTITEMMVNEMDVAAMAPEHAAYKIGSIIFETILEGDCHATCNGHHLAQELSARLGKLQMKK